MQHKETPTELVKLVDIDHNIRNTMRWLVRMHPFIHTLGCCEGSKIVDRPYIDILVCDVRDLDNIKRDLEPCANIVFDRSISLGDWAIFNIVFHSKKELLDLEELIDLKKVNQQDCWCPLEDLLLDEKS